MSNSPEGNFQSFQDLSSDVVQITALFGWKSIAVTADK
jgi:hypothetical protein